MIEEMTDIDRQKSIKQIFASAIELEADSRDAYIREACGGDNELLTEVKSWLASYIESENFIETPIFSANSLIEQPAPMTGRHFGNFEIIREIGSGGMGAVYLAKRTDGEFEQLVALKIVRQSIAETQLIERFRRERQILASLNHPNIAKLLDGGVSDRGEPYIVMEFVEGTTISEFAKSKQLNIRDRLTLFVKVCAAVEFAHRSLIVHRDIKPGNILVTGEGEPKLLDFGLARLIDDGSSINASQTRTAFTALTPAYASPEQLRNEPITTASDTYSLGVVLYELLSGRRPFELKTTSFVEIVQHISATEPSKPSQVYAANEPSTQPNSQLKGDLDNIVLMSLRKEPERRYKTAADLAADIERHLEHLPVRARPNTLIYRSEKFIKRNKLPVIAASFVLIALIAGMITTIWQARVAARERDQAQQAQAKSEQLNSFLQNILLAASPEEKGKDAKVIDVLADAVEKIDIDFADQPALKAQALLTVGQTYDSLGLVDEATQVLRRALKLNTDLYGENDPSTVSCMIHLGAVIINQTKYAEAEDLLTKAIETDRRISHDGNKDFAYALNAIGELYVRKGEFEKAKPFLQESIAMSDKLFGEDNPDSAFALISLARAQAFSADSAGAEITYRRSIAIYRRLPARYEMRLAVALLNFGSLLSGKGNYDEGISMMREAEAIFLRKQGESYPTFEAKTYLCTAYITKSDFGQAVIEGTRAIEMGRKLNLEKTPDFINTQRFLGLALTRTGKANEAEPILRQSLEASKTDLPNTVPLAKGALGECLTEQQKYAEARQLLSESYEYLNKSLGAEHPSTVLAKSRLENVSKKMNDPKFMGR